MKAITVFGRVQEKSIGRSKQKSSMITAKKRLKKAPIVKVFS
jgi:hypothetical protein